MDASLDTLSDLIALADR